MTNSYKLGPGVFTIGVGPLAVQAQLTNLRVEWSENVTSEEDLNLLDGTTLQGDQSATYRATISGNVVQDLAAAGFVAFTWDSKGEEVAFTFVPNNDITREVTGTCVPVPVTIGGDVKTRPRSDFTFRCVGDPVLGNVV